VVCMQPAVAMALVSMSVALAACVTPNDPLEVTQAQAVDQIRFVDLSPRFPERPRTAQKASDGATPVAATYYGEQTVASKSAPKPDASRADAGGADPSSTGALGDQAAQPNARNSGYEMNFENTPVATLAKAILGDILGVGYTIDPRVQGTVNLSSGRPVPRKDLVYVLESALRASGIALVREGRSYRLIPSSDAVGTGSIDRAQNPDAGYGISVVPLQFVSAQILTKLLDSFAAKPGMVRADPSRNLIVIQGTAADRSAAIETVLNFDADWLSGQSVGIYPVANSTPEPIISEIERIVDAGEGGLSQNSIKLQPIARQNAILVVSRKPEFLKTVSTWITRLDKSGKGATVYRMRYGDARQAAALLNDIFVGNSSSGLDSPANQLAPGGGVIASSSSRSNILGSQLGSGISQSGAAGTSVSAPTFDARFADSSGGRTTGGPPGGRSGAQVASTTSSAAVPVLPNVRIAADAANNALLIFANPESYQIIERTLQQIDRPQLQVAIDATVAEITLNDKLSYGVQFFLNSRDVGLGPDKGSVLNTAGSAVINRVLPGFNFLVGAEAQPRVILDALRQVTDVKIMSTPSVVVVDNQVASLQVGDQVPITTQTAQVVNVATAPIVNNIDYRNTGVILRVAPRVNANGSVLLDVEQEISSVANNAAASTLTPTISQRRVRSSIAVQSGQTVLLAGLISERRDRSRQGIPGLTDIPYVGDLFSQQSATLDRTELIIFIRPQIIRNGVDAAHIADELRYKMRGIRGKQPTVPAVFQTKSVAPAN
jgi:general secretion pathway protein D